MSDKYTNNIGTLATPSRNNFFYGKLMDENQFKKEQKYFIHRRAIMNRFLLGSGVVAGLNIQVNEDGVQITPGAAIDHLGREIIVPDTVQVDPSVLTDEHGDALGTINDGEVAEICLQYREIKVDPVPVFVPDCDNNGNCAASTIQEDFVIIVRAPIDTPVDAADDPEDLDLSAAGIQEWFCTKVGESVIDTSADVCVMLGTVKVGDPHVIEDGCEKKNLAYSNQLLFELILALAKKIDEIP